MSEFVETLLARMTVREKIGQLNLVTSGGDVMTGIAANSNIIQKVRAGEVGSIFAVKAVDDVRALQDQAMKSRLKIPLMFAEDVIHGHRTIFPVNIGLASTWNMDLIERAARVAAIEASAEGIDQVYAPMIDVARDPRWGCIAESPGEDPYLAAEYAAAHVRGFQEDDVSSPTSVMSCLKHFVAYGAAEGGRDYAAANLSPAQLHDVYMPPFVRGMKEGAGSLMAAFNTINGRPMHGHDVLIDQVMRRIYGFEGLVVADYEGIKEMIGHRVAADKPDAARLALKAGVDFDMVSELYLNTLEDSIKAGLIDKTFLDAACRRVLQAKEELGLFADPYRRMNAEPVALCAEHRALAREAAAEACVLLKNENAVLPLKRADRVLLVGPLVADRVNVHGTWAVAGNPDDAVTVFEGMQHYGDNIVPWQGANITDDRLLASRFNCHNPVMRSVTNELGPSDKLIESALYLAKNVDTIVAVVGEGKEQSGESSSSMSLELSPGQKALLAALKETGKPVVVIVMAGRPMVLRDEAKIADAMLLSWFGGTEAGNGIADILYGAKNPSGHLTATLPYHEGQIPAHYAHESTGRPNPGHFEKFKTGYVDMPDGVSHAAGLYPFGYGLSYTSFDYTEPTLKLNKKRDALTVTATVTNSGDVPGKDVVQLYVRDEAASRSRPVRELKGFEKIELQPGESREVSFTLTRADLSFSIAEHIADTRRVWEEGEFTVGVGPNSRDLKEAKIDWKGSKHQSRIEFTMS